MDIDFYSKYINVNFDNIVDNELVNSNEFYLTYKKEYMEETQSNYILYKEYSQELSKLNDFYNINNKKYNYVYIDTDKIDKLKIKIKNLIKSQNNSFDNFNHYISILNTNKNLFKPKIKQKNFFSKFKF
jgi:hydroxymethylpyrimidine pyrophosphatase-like HAD family hydrolase